jgi:hypothetical protein
MNRLIREDLRSVMLINSLVCKKLTTDGLNDFFLHSMSGIKSLDSSGASQSAFYGASSNGFTQVARDVDFINSLLLA